jgi:hypothetical protein
VYPYHQEPAGKDMVCLRFSLLCQQQQAEEKSDAYAGYVDHFSFEMVPFLTELYCLHGSLVQIYQKQ